jgi:hypothetical protein
MARTLSKKETVNQYGAPSSKMKALQEIKKVDAPCCSYTKLAPPPQDPHASNPNSIAPKLLSQQAKAS